MTPAPDMLADMADPRDILHPRMSAEEFARAQRLLGWSDDQTAHNLGLSRNGDVQVRRIKRGRLPCSGPIATLMRAFLDGWRAPWTED